MVLVLSLSIIPALVLYYFIIRKEKYNVNIILKLMLYGLLAIIPCILIGNYSDEILGKFLVLESNTYSLVDNFLFTGFVEEMLKFLPFYIFVFLKKRYRYSYEILIYLVSISFSFAVFENIFYSLEGGIVIAIIRAFTSVPGHLMFQVIMGYFILKFLKTKNTINIVYAIIIPTLLHGTFDYLLSDFGNLIKIGCYIIIMITLYITSFKILAQSKRHNKQINNKKYISKINFNYPFKNVYNTMSNKQIVFIKIFNFLLISSFIGIVGAIIIANFSSDIVKNEIIITRIISSVLIIGLILFFILLYLAVIKTMQYINKNRKN